MKTARIVANIIVGVALAVLLVGLVWITVDERCSKAESAARSKPFVQEVKFK